MERTPRVPCGATVTLLGTGAILGAGLMLLAVLAGLVPSLGPQRQQAGQATQPSSPPPASQPIFGAPRYVREEPLPLTDTDTATPDVILTVQSYADGATQTVLVYLEGDSRRERWTSPLLGDKSYERFLAAGPELVYVADGARLLALSRRDGATVWERTLSDTIQNICRNCLQLAGDRLAALSQDGVLQTFDAQSGDAVWSARLNEVPRQLVVLGEAVGVLDYPEDGGSDASLVLFAASDGARLRPSDSACPSSDSNYRQYPGIYDQLYPDGAGRAVYAVVTGSEGCVMRLGPGGKQEWATPADGTPLENWSTGSLLITPEALYGGTDSTLLELDAGTGAPRVVATEEDYDLTPLAARDGVLVVEAIRTRGSRRAELWGVDLTSGERRWGIVLVGDEYLAPHESGGDWSGSLVKAGYAVVQAIPDKGQLQIDVLSLADGSSAASATLQVDDSSFSWGGVAWTGDELWVTADRLFVIDTASAQLRFAWP